MSNTFTKHKSSSKTHTSPLPNDIVGLAINPADKSKGVEVVPSSSQPTKRRSTVPTPLVSSKKLKVLGVRGKGKNLLKVLLEESWVKEDLDLIHGARISTNLRSAHDSLFRVLAEVGDFYTLMQAQCEIKGTAEAKCDAAVQVDKKADEALKLVRDSLNAKEEINKDQVAHVEQTKIKEVARAEAKKADFFKMSAE